MRIAVVNVTNRKIGGVETYLDTVIPALARQGHKLAFLYEITEPRERDEVTMPENSPSWCVAELGEKRAVALLRAWQPDLIYAHKFADADLETQIQTIAPSVFFIHDYYGTCISGMKTFKQPVVTPCHRRFGWQCMVNYFPRRCGGLNPLTMVKLYQLQSKRLESLRSYDAIATHSEHMMNELVLHGLEVQRVHNFPYYVKPAKKSGQTQDPMVQIARGNVPASPANPAYWQLLFSGRQELLKGGHVFLEALPAVSAALDRPVRVIFAGDGRERERLQQQAAALQKSNAQLQIDFPGWMNRDQMEALFRRSDLLVVPSLWPEPFGLVGPEAGLRSVPVAAFNVGGIPDWLKDGVNGALAPGDPPTADGLAQAIIQCLSDPAKHTQLRCGAFEVAQQFNVREHLASLMNVFEFALEHRRINRPISTRRSASSFRIFES